MGRLQGTRHVVDEPRSPIVLDTGSGQAIAFRAAQHNADVVLIDAEVDAYGAYDAAIWAVGRVPNSESLDMRAGGVEMEKHGHVIANLL
ncbi:MAG TPA: hypothetical protein VGC19_03830 [Rhodanobacter sp.]